MSYQDILPEEVDKLCSNENITIFDTRDVNNYSKGHLEGAIQISDQALKKLIMQKRRHNPILVYCYHGNSSKDVCALLNGIGFTEVYNLTGGWLAWQNFITETI